MDALCGDSLDAHKEIEDLTSKSENWLISSRLSKMSCLISSIMASGLTQRQALIAYLKSTQQVVNGTAKVKLYKGSAINVACKSNYSLRRKVWLPIPVQILLIRMPQLGFTAMGSSAQGSCKRFRLKAQIERGFPWRI